MSCSARLDEAAWILEDFVAHRKKLLTIIIISLSFPFLRFRHLSLIFTFVLIFLFFTFVPAVVLLSRTLPFVLQYIFLSYRPPAGYLSFKNKQNNRIIIPQISSQNAIVFYPHLYNTLVYRVSWTRATLTA